MRAAPPTLRSFGRAEDLDLEFGDTDRPGLVTALLARCAEPRDPQFWWAQPVGARIAALLQLLALTDGCESLSLRSRCTEPGCGEVFELELPLAALVNETPDAAPLQIALGGGRAVTMRRPTGQDLRDWRALAPTSRENALSVMLDTLCLEGRVTPHDEAALAAAIATHDSLVAFAVACRCPACGTAHEVPVDLEGVVLARLSARQRMLLREVHQLASRYGWTESDVLAIPPTRRARYLALIEDEG